MAWRCFRQSVWLVVALAAVAACGGSGSSAPGVDSGSSSPPTRVMKIVFAGAISGEFLVIPGNGNLCGTHLAGEPHSVNYFLSGHVAGAGDDIGIDINFAVHGYTKPGTFAVGAFPAGTVKAPAIVSVGREITARDIKAWASGSGSVVVDAGAVSGTLDLRLNSGNGLGELDVSGVWVCPQGSLT